MYDAVNQVIPGATYGGTVDINTGRTSTAHQDQVALGSDSSKRVMSESSDEYCLKVVRCNTLV